MRESKREWEWERVEVRGWRHEKSIASQKCVRQHDPEDPLRPALIPLTPLISEPPCPCDAVDRK
jgi:hypothetical protein